MTGLDTNVLVRYLTQDDPAQTAAAVKIIRSLNSSSPGFVSLVVIAELVWVLQISYDFKKAEIEHVIEKLLRSNELIVDQAETVSQALRRFRDSRADFADCLIERCCDAAHCHETVTFDKGAVSAGMRLLKA